MPGDRGVGCAPQTDRHMRILGSWGLGVHAASCRPVDDNAAGSRQSQGSWELVAPCIIFAGRKHGTHQTMSALLEELVSAFPFPQSSGNGHQDRGAFKNEALRL
mmetsp:Transcript_105004/g.177375  ORF Transcript_105004/g.177375 Transcript_105004/m.177375 type:complete len:104 (-) Transcript_105004:41-352(-)